MHSTFMPLAALHGNEHFKRRERESETEKQIRRWSKGIKQIEKSMRFYIFAAKENVIYMESSVLFPSHFLFHSLELLLLFLYQSKSCVLLLFVVGNKKKFFVISLTHTHTLCCRWYIWKSFAVKWNRFWLFIWKFWFLIEQISVQPLNILTP